MKKRFLSLFLSMLMVFAVLPNNVAMAFQNRAGNYSKKYSLTGNYANDIVSVAKAQIGKIQSYLGYSEAWCADFVMDCARLAKIPDNIIPCNYSGGAYVPNLYNYLINNCGASKVSTRQAGDILFYYCSACKGYKHVAIVMDGTYSIEGNYWINNISQVVKASSYWDDCGHSTSNYVSRVYVRPKYKKSPPSAPSNVNLSALHTAVGNTITASWNKVSNASGYNAELICNSNSAHNRSVKVTGTSASFNLPVEGNYTVRVSAYNSAGTSSATSSGTITAHAPSTVTFVDYDDTVINTQSVRYGESAIMPAAPPREGYTFQGWDKGTQGITQNTTIKATYKINVYNVVFKDSDGSVISTQRIEHGSSAKAPANPTPETGYIFVGWNYPDFGCVRKNMTITAVYAWGNNDLPIVAEITRAVRKSNSLGYDISVSTKNFPSNVTKAKIIASLKTEENKMVASETKQIYLNETENPTHNLFISYEGVATTAEVEVVGIVDDDKTGVPLAACDTADVDLGLAWSNWSDIEPKNPNGDLMIESRTEYRYSDKETKTSNTSAMAGYTLYNTTSEWGGWSGWSRNAVGASNTRQVNTRTIPATYQKRWTYCRWVNNAGNTSSYAGVYSNYQTIDLDYRLSAKGTVDGHTRYGWHNNYGKLGGNYLADWWWHEGSYNKQTAAAYTEYQYRDLNYTYHFYKWGNWSDWTPEEVASNDNRQIETRTAYRYKSKAIKTPIYNYKRYKYINPATNTEIYTYDTTYPDSMGYVGEWEYTESESELAVVATVDYDIKLYNGYKNDSWYSAAVNEQGDKKEYITYKTLEDTAGEKYTISGAIAQIGDEVDGKQATLLVYKGKNTDPTATQIEAISQTTLNANGEYMFSFKTKEIPTSDTGDFILMLGVEGATKPVYIDTIEAPKPEYKVVFVDGDTVLSEQTVKEGDSAKAPENLSKDGYTFVGWDTGLSNVHDDLTITANYIQNQYSVIFVDWNNNDIAVKTFGHGDVIQAPEPSEIEGHHFVEWKDIIDGQTVVTENMVIMADYEVSRYTVKFMNWDNTVIKEETITYGETVDIPDEIPEKEGLIFAGWSNSIGLFSVSEDLTVYPLFEYPENTDIPSASVSSGEVNNEQKIRLDCPSDNAKIYYSLVQGIDNSDENNFDADSLEYQEYTEPIVINEDSTLIFYAVEDEKNKSSYVIERYIVSRHVSTNTLVKYTTSGIKFQVTCDSNVANAVIMAAVYDRNGRMLSFDTQECDGVDEYILHVNKTGNEKYAKIMIWNGLNKMKPFGATERISIE